MSDNVPPMTDAALLALLRFDPARDADPAAKARVLGRVQTTIGGLGGLAAQAAWTVALTGLTLFIWRFAVRRYSAVGN